MITIMGMEPWLFGLTMFITLIICPLIVAWIECEMVEIELSIFPWEFYSETDMNWFGCIVCSLIVIPLTLPFMAFKLIYWLFHVGKERW